MCVSFSSFIVDDASGHYTPGLFYGNHFWMGSLSLCRSIYKAPNTFTPIVIVPERKLICTFIWSLWKYPKVFAFIKFMIGFCFYSPKAKSHRCNLIQWFQHEWLSTTWKSTICARILRAQSASQRNRSGEICKFVSSNFTFNFASLEIIMSFVFCFCFCS